MRKILLVIFSLLILVACGNGVSGESLSEDLQSKKWNVVATNGESYTAEFAQDTVSFQMGFFTLGMHYELDGNTIILTEEDKTYSYEIKKENEEYKFTASTAETRDKFGDLTLSPAKE
ncbi:hypothetical protein [Oceanobacillus caeni]|uniref:hypothetical protein n=1 Tax=Bacillaceae TaxID=186817 RepID=UPI001C24560F|nr:hypothetical protein [Oceanobacillus caeni]MBU8791572.1 hypothetical protein [Oceanobacillus caeni]